MILLDSTNDGGALDVDDATAAVGNEAATPTATPTAATTPAFGDGSGLADPPINTG